MFRWYSCEVSCEETRFLCQWPLQSPHQLMMHKQHELIGFCNVNSVKILRWRLQIYMVSHKFVCSQLVCEHGLREPVKKKSKKSGKFHPLRQGWSGGGGEGVWTGSFIFQFPHHFFPKKVVFKMHFFRKFSTLWSLEGGRGQTLVWNFPHLDSYFGGWLYYN